MDPDELMKRTQTDVLRSVGWGEGPPKTDTCRVPGRPLWPRGASAGANERTACRAKPVAGGRSKMNTVEAKSDATISRMKRLAQSGHVRSDQQVGLVTGGGGRRKPTVASIDAARRNLRGASRPRCSGHSAIRNPQSATE